MNVTDPLANAIAERVAELLSKKPPIAANQGVSQRLYSIDQAAVYLGRTPKAVRQMCDRGLVPVVRLDGRVFLDRLALDQWIADSTVKAV